MAITHYIDSTATEIARARIKSTTNRVPEAFPVLVYGDTRPHNFVFWNGQTGSVESYSGNASYSLRVTLGQVQEGPKEGTYNVTCGSTESVPALADAETLQDALNLLTTIISEGGVVVTGTFPNFLVTWNTVGVKTAFTVDSTLLIPQTGISLVTMQTGSASVVNQVAVVLRQAAISSQTSWTVISSPQNGWTGTITTNTAGALNLLSTQGEKVGNALQVATLLTAEVLDNSGIPVSYYQTPVILRAKNLDPNGTLSPVTSGYTLGDILYGNAQGGLSKLPGSTSVTLKVLSQTGDGVNSAAPAWVDPDTQGVASITGTANQIAASASTGNVTLSLDGPHNFTSLTSTALLLGAGTSAITASNLTYSTPTLSVPDAFNVSSAGSISLTAGGSNKNITAVPSGTGAFAVNFNDSPDTVARFVLGNDGAAATTALVAYGANATYRGFGAGGTRASPTFTASSQVIGGLSAGGWFNGALSPSSKASIFFQAPATWTNTSTPTDISFGTTIVGSTTLQNNVWIRNYGTLQVGQANLTRTTAWGTSGTIFTAGGPTITDGASSGTVATATGSSFAVPTFAASSATTFTNAANLYIAGDVAAGTNVTLTNSYGLWNVGKTRLDGAVQIPSANTAGIQLYNTTDQVTNYERLDINWVANEAVISSRGVGGTGIIRPLRLRGSLGDVLLNNSSTAGQIQINGGTTSAAGAIGFRFQLFQSTATSGSNIGLALTPTYNQTSGTAANTDLLINRTETAVGSGAQLLIDAQVGSASKFSVDNAGRIAVGAAALSASTAAMHPASTTSVSSLRIPHGSAPSSPVNGDMWTTTAGLFIRINGSTVGPLS